MKLAFTLIELLIVIAIIAIIAAIAIPNMAQKSPPLDPATIHIGDTVRLPGYNGTGIVVDMLPARGDGQPMRIVVRHKNSHNDYVTNDFFASELHAP